MKKLLLLLAVAVGFSVTGISFADPPSSSPSPLPTLDPNELSPLVPVQPAPGASQGVQDRIRDALKGDQTIGAGDPVLDDVLQIIQQRGSILRGSSLEELAEPTKSRESGASQRARAAESLLKAARHLEQTGPLDDAQGKLIRQMRLQSAQLLVAESTPNPAD